MMGRLIAGLLGFLVATAACSVDDPLGAQAIGVGQNSEESAVLLVAATDANVLWGPDRDLEAGYRLLTPSCREQLSFDEFVFGLSVAAALVEEARGISAAEITLVNHRVVELEGSFARVAYDVVDGDGNLIVPASDDNADVYRRIDGTWLAACEP